MASLKDYRQYLSGHWTVFLIQNHHLTEFCIKHLTLKYSIVSLFNFSNNIKVVIHILLLEIACSLTHNEIKHDWEWLHNNVTDTLCSFDNEEDITEFVCCKIQSVLAATQENIDVDGMYHKKYTFYKYPIVIFGLLVK